MDIQIKFFMRLQVHFWSFRSLQPYHKNGLWSSFQMTVKSYYTIAIITAMLIAGSKISFMVRAPRWLLKSFSTNLKQNQNQSQPVHTIFPRLWARYRKLFWLVHHAVCTCCDWSKQHWIFYRDLTPALLSEASRVLCNPDQPNDHHIIASDNG